MYSIFSMSRMLKDKIVNTLYHKKFQNERVEKNGPSRHYPRRKLNQIVPRAHAGNGPGIPRNTYNASNFSCLTENNVGLIINITF